MIDSLIGLDVGAPIGRIVVGTASWIDKSLIVFKRFCSPKCNSAEDRLRYYA